MTNKQNTDIFPEQFKCKNGEFHFSLLLKRTFFKCKQEQEKQCWRRKYKEDAGGKLY